MDALDKTIEKVAGAVQGQNPNVAVAVLLEVTAHVIKTSENPKQMTQTYLKRFAETMNGD